MGLGSVSENGNGVFLTVAGGFIWNRKADESDPNYATQEYKANGETGIREGARYGDITGKIINAYFTVHPEYGQNLNTVFEDSDKNRYIVSISTSHKYCRSMMQMLLKADLTKDVFANPYDFLDKKTKKSKTGISFKQDGQKLNIWNDDAPSKDEDWFKNSAKKLIKRYYEDLNDWYVDEVTKNICPLFENSNSDKVEQKKEYVNVDDSITPLKMKKAIKAYISENYEGQEMPTLTKEEVESWYKLVLAEEELPFKEDEEPDSSVDQGDLNDQLDALLDKNEDVSDDLSF